MGKFSRDKGLRRERQIVAMHVDLGVHAERVPLSGASRYQGNGSDIDVYPHGKDAPPLCGEVKSRSNGEGFAVIERWLADNDMLFLVRDQEQPGQTAPPPLVVLPWRRWAELIGGKQPDRSAP